MVNGHRVAKVQRPGEITAPWTHSRIPQLPRNNTQANFMKSFARHWTAGLVLAAVLSSVHGSGSDSSASISGEGSSGSISGDASAWSISGDASAGSISGDASVGSISGKSSSGSTSRMHAITVFSDSACAEVTFVNVSMKNDGDSYCKTQECDFSSKSEDAYFYEISCVSDYSELVSSKSSYLVAQTYTEDDSCVTEDSVGVFLADGKCHPSEDSSFTATLNSDGSGVLVLFEGPKCKGSEDKITLSKDALAAQSCIGNVKYAAHSAATTTTTPAAATATPSTTSSGSGLSLASSLLAATLGGLAVLFL